MRLVLADLSGLPVGPPPGLGDFLDDDALAAVYGVPSGHPVWLRTNFAASLDGAIVGGDGRSASVNTPADHAVFDLLRALSDVLLVGAGTVRNERYAAQSVADRWAGIRARLGLAPGLPLVAVTRQGVVPPSLLGLPAGSALLATCEQAPGLPDARDQLGDDWVLVHGRDSVDLTGLRDDLVARGRGRILCEGGPGLLASLLDEDLIDEVCLSVTPRLVGGDGSRMLTGLARDEPYLPTVLVEEDGTVMGRWMRPSLSG